MKTLNDLLTGVAQLKKPDLWASCSDKIYQENLHLKKIIEERNVKVYGTSTLTGHRESTKVDDKSYSAIQHEILNSHAIAYGAPPYSDYQARCVTYAKMYSWAAGGTGVSPVLYDEVARLSTDPGFQPYIPSGASYSSGDVIPAAHWAVDVIRKLGNKDEYTLEPGAAMALINGGFIHVGLAASTVRAIEFAYALFLELTMLEITYSAECSTNLYYFANAERAWTTASIRYIQSKTEQGLSAPLHQDPISLRATPQVLETMCVAMEAYLSEINYLIFKPSGNPLIDPTVPFPLSQASFLCPTLTVRTSGLIEALLFTMWAVVNRTNHLLSGKIDGFPPDGSSKEQPLGLIQYPKLMMAKLEAIRAECGVRAFTSGSQTSYGLEDLWTNGVHELAQIEKTLKVFIELCTIEAFVLADLIKMFRPNHLDRNLLLKAVSESEGLLGSADIVQGIYDSGGLDGCRHLFPVKS